MDTYTYKPGSAGAEALSLLSPETQAFVIQQTTNLFDEAHEINGIVNDAIVSTQGRVLGQLDSYIKFMLPLYDRKPLRLNTDQKIVALVQTGAQKARMYMDMNK